MEGHTEIPAVGRLHWEMGGGRKEERRGKRKIGRGVRGSENEQSILYNATCKLNED